MVRESTGAVVRSAPRDFPHNGPLRHVRAAAEKHLQKLKDNVRIRKRGDCVFCIEVRSAMAMGGSSKAEGRGTQQRAVALVYCPMCTHTVEAKVIMKAKHLKVEEGQECSHCHSALDAGFVLPRAKAIA